MNKIDNWVLSLILMGMIFVPFVVAELEENDNILAEITVSETAGLERIVDYVVFPLQLTSADFDVKNNNIIALDKVSGEKTNCQVIQEKSLPDKSLSIVRIIFPVSINPQQSRTFILKEDENSGQVETSLRIKGEGLELKVENEYYLADLTKRNEPEPKMHASGQLQELVIKLGFNQLLTNEEDRIHWAPNFKREELEYYTTIAHWENPQEYKVYKGDYLISTLRKDLAPHHPEIMLTAVYQFYDGLPYFRFYSEMEFLEDLPLELLRNDEMTMDSMFTHLAFRRPDGNIVDVKMEERDQILKKQPIEDDAYWICFYNIDHGFAFGTIRLRYDNHNKFGELSPTYLPHTQIGEWVGRKYWNRRLIHNHLTLIPKGSRYIEENAYLVFNVRKQNPFSEIQYWSDRLQNPLVVSVYPKGITE